jgi:hypothetical protein
LEKPILDTFETAQYLRRSPGAIRNLVLRRAIPFRKVAGRLVFLRCEIEEFVKNSPGLKLEDMDK